MKYIYTFLLIILTACVYTSCSQPVGSINGSNGSGGGTDVFFVIAIKDEIYLQTEDQRRFYRRPNHLKVIGAGIYDNALKIEIFTDPLAIVPTPPLNITLNPLAFYEFTQPGQYIVRGTYNGKQDEYPITVYDKDPSGGGGSTGVGMEWLP